MGIAVAGAYIIPRKINESASATTSSTPPTITIAESDADQSVAGNDMTNTSSSTTGYTLAEVATHDNESSCWTAVNGNVYDLTSALDSHPGGKKNIMKLCGIDGTAAFTAQHSGQSRPESGLANLYIGPLTN